jgi:hypothetical protein
MPGHLYRITSLTLITIALCLPGAALSAGMACQVRRDAAQSIDNASPRQADDAGSVAALMKTGVPLELDAAGSVRWIEAVKGELDDTAMRRLPGLRSLEWLEIGGGKVSAAGLGHLRACPTIRRLYVHDLALGDDSLTWLSRLTSLEALSLQRTGLSGRAIGNLKATGTLAVLNLSDTNVADRDLAGIARLKGLEVLALTNTKVTGAGLARLKGMPRLNVLNLAGCEVRDADLEPFLSMPNLRIVYAAGSKISEAAVKDYGQKLPMLSIFR